MSNGCAQDANGNLLSPSKIQFFFDVDDEVPLPSLPSSSTPAPVPTSGPPAAASSSSSSKFKPTPITHFFAANTVAGIRRSGRATRPSTRVTDPDNLESNVFGKRKADSAASGDKQQPPSQRLRKAASDDNKDAKEPSDGDAGAAGHATETSEFDVMELTDKATSDEDVEERYASTKALGDADRKVSVDVYLQYTRC